MIAYPSGRKGSCFVRAMLILIIALAFISCSRESIIRDSRIAMGTAVTLTFYNRKDAALSEGAFSIIYDIENMISFHDSESYISRINDSAGIAPVAVPEKLFNLIVKAIEISDGSGGAFNPLMGAVTSLWNIGSDNARVPSEEELSQALLYLDTDDILLNDEECTVYLKKKGMKLDLGGIGKGFCADEIRDYLVSNGVSSAIINLGGNIYAIGRKPDGRKFRIGIANPDGGAYIAEVEASDSAVVTSGAYERFSDIDGRRYHHIFTSSGYPSDSDLLSATIISSDSIYADALSTAVFASGSASAGYLSEKYGVGIITYDKYHEIRSYGL